MASYRLKPLFAIKECSSCGSFYTRECCSIGSLKNKILVPEPDSSPCCAKCRTPVDGSYCRGCTFLRKKFEEDLLTYCVENGIFQDFQDTSESSDDNTNVVNAPREPFVVNQDPGEKSSQGPPLINQNCCYECGDSLDGIFFVNNAFASFVGKVLITVIIVHQKFRLSLIQNNAIKPLMSSHRFCQMFILHAIMKMRIHSSMIPNLILSMFLQVFSPTLHNPSSRHIRASYVETILTTVMIVHHDSCLSMSRNRATIKTLVIIIIHKIHQVFSTNILVVFFMLNCGSHYDYQCQPINETYYEPNPSYDYSGFDHPQPPQDSVDCQEALDKILEELEEIKRDQRMLKELKKRIAEEQTAKENMSIEEMRHEQQLVDYKIKEIMNDLGYKRFRGEKIDEEYERDCEIRIRKLKQDFNEWGSEVRKKEQAYNEEQYSAARRRMLSIPFVDEDDYIPLGDIIARYSTSKAITPDLPIEEPDNSLNMGDEHLDTIPATESDEVIKSSVENLVPIPSEFEGISDDTSDVPNCDNNRINVESDLVESLINRDTSIVYSSKIDPILEEFAGELAHIAPIPPGIVEADFDPNDDTSSDDDSFENIEYVDASPSYSELVSLEKVNDVDQEEKEFDLEDIFQIQDVNLREKLLKISRLITNIEALKDNPNPIPVTDSDSSNISLSNSNNSLPEFETFSDHTEETRSGSTTTHANYSLPEYDSFLF
ncbi:hypothetical protein Tco_0805582 [Tanacetum coccineum]